MTSGAIMPERVSPVHAVVAATATRWTTRNRMALAADFADMARTALPVWLMDVSHRFRFGFKGAGAPAWCSAQGLTLPGAPNTWAQMQGGGLVGRLAFTEFYVEHEDEALVTRLTDALGRGVQMPAGGVYPVHRRDAGMVLGGARAQDVLVQVCNVNFGAVDVGAMPLIMTLVVGVAVTVFPMIEDGQTVYRMACDPTFAPHLWSTLAEIAADCGGASLVTL